MLETIKDTILVAKILIFGKTILLTPFPVDIKESYFIQLAKPISSISTGASITISSKEIHKAWLGDLGEIDKTFPQGSIVVKLYDKKGEVLVFDRIAYSQKGLILFSFESIEKKFYSVEIVTQVPMTEAQVWWTNYWW